MIGTVLNLLDVVHDPAWLKRLGDAVSAAFAGVVFGRPWMIFPFDLGSWSPGWAAARRFALGLLAVVMAMALLANLAQSLHHGIEPTSPSEGDA